MTAAQMRIQSAARFIDEERKRGKSDGEIRSLLSVNETAPNHPCSSSLLRNICSSEEVGAAFELLDKAKAGVKKGVDSAVSSGLHPILLIAAGSGAAYLAGGALRKFALVGGAAGVAWWLWRGRQ